MYNIGVIETFSANQNTPLIGQSNFPRKVSAIYIVIYNLKTRLTKRPGRAPG
jgi:hypothetical protein